MVGFHPTPHHFFQKKWTKSVHFIIQDEGLDDFFVKIFDFHS